MRLGDAIAGVGGEASAAPHGTIIIFQQPAGSDAVPKFGVVDGNRLQPGVLYIVNERCEFQEAPDDEQSVRCQG